MLILFTLSLLLAFYSGGLIIAITALHIRPHVFLFSAVYIVEPISNFAVYKTLKIFLSAEDHFMHNIKDKLISMNTEFLIYMFH
jgi:hypothetical protein